MSERTRENDRIFENGVRAGRIAGNREARFMEATIQEAIRIIRFAHHEHAFSDDHCTPANCSVAEWLDQHAEAAATSSPAGNGEPPEWPSESFVGECPTGCGCRVYSDAAPNDCGCTGPCTAIEATRDAAPGLEVGRLEEALISWVMDEEPDLEGTIVAVALPPGPPRELAELIAARYNASAGTSSESNSIADPARPLASPKSGGSVDSRRD